MSKIKYRATFADGTSITRASHREYLAAWRYSYVGTDGKTYDRSGFAGTRALAERAVVNESRFCSERAGFKTEVADAVKLDTPAPRGLPIP